MWICDYLSWAVGGGTGEEGHRTAPPRMAHSSAPGLWLGDGTGLAGGEPLGVAGEKRSDASTKRLPRVVRREMSQAQFRTARPPPFVDEDEAPSSFRRCLALPQIQPNASLPLLLTHQRNQGLLKDRGGGPTQKPENLGWLEK